jgi:cobalt transporter subunit CbtB
MKPVSVGGTEEGDATVTNLATQTVTVPRTTANRAVPALAALFLGAALILVAGFAWPSALHNATHDTRHALGLPCH